jgi:hypothetical protein
MTPSETFAACGFYLQPGHFSTQDLEVVTSGGELFALLKPVFYLSQDGRLFQFPRGAQTDGISAPAMCAAVGRGKGGNDFCAGVFHDGVFRGWLMLWEPGAGLVRLFGNQDAPVGLWVKARLSEAEGDAFLRECALACGDSEIEADTLYWAVKTFGHRFYSPVY